MLERGAVEGEVFHHGVVQALDARRGRGCTTRLTALVRKELIRPDRPVFAGDDAFRFRHLLMRDAAYDGMPKAERAALHEQFADWLARARKPSSSSWTSLSGTTSSRRYRYRQELGQPDDDEARRPRRRAARWWGGQGARSSARTIGPASRCSSERRILLPDDRRDETVRDQPGLEPVSTHGGAPRPYVGGSPKRQSAAAAVGNRVAELGLRMDHAAYQITCFEPTGAQGHATPRLGWTQGLPVLEAARDDWGLTWYGLRRAQPRSGATAARFARNGLRGPSGSSSTHDERTSHLIDQLGPVHPAPHAHTMGVTPVEECLRWLDEHPELERRSVLPHRQRLLAMLGRFDEAHRLLAEAANRAPSPASLRFHQVSRASLRRRDAPERRRRAEGQRGRRASAGAPHGASLGNFMWFCCNLAQALYSARPGR